jgi:predicted nucleotidyltransferase
MKTLLEIEAELRVSKAYLFSKYPLKRLAIFGSYARNQQTENSDIDLMAEFDGKIGIRFIDLADELEGIVGGRVDLVSRNGIKDKYFQAIKNQLIYV